METVKLDNLVLEGAVNSGLKELSVLKSRNGELKRQLTEIEADKTILALDEQIIVLEDLIEEKKKQEKNGDIIILEDSLKVASDRKKEVIKTKQGHMRRMFRMCPGISWRHFNFLKVLKLSIIQLNQILQLLNQISFPFPVAVQIL